MNRHDDQPSKPRIPVEQHSIAHSLPLSNDELRRQLGWGLIDSARASDQGTRPPGSRA